MSWIKISVIIILFVHCSQRREKQFSLPEEKKDTISTDHKSISISYTIEYDSIIIAYWKSTEANKYYFKYSNDKVQITSEYSSFNRQLTDTLIIDKFKNYVVAFYVEKRDQIDYGPIDQPYIEEANYPMIKAQGFKKGKEIFNKETILYGNIKFNPKFIEFYEFLDKFISSSASKQNS